MLFWLSVRTQKITARGKIITPLKDRIGAEVHTHYPASVQMSAMITEQEAWTKRNGGFDP